MRGGHRSTWKWDSVKMIREQLWPVTFVMSRHSASALRIQQQETLNQSRETKTGAEEIQDGEKEQLSDAKRDR